MNIFNVLSSGSSQPTENLIECVVRLFIAIEFGNFVYAYRVLYIFQYAVDNTHVFNRLCFIHITGLPSILFRTASGRVFVSPTKKKKRMKRNTFSFIVAILIISQVIASIYVYQKTPLPHPMKCSWYVKCALSVCHRTFYQSWFSIPVMQLYNKKNGFSLKWCVTDHVIALDICISYYFI